MQKFVAFLEKHVQWVALGLGAIYLLYMVWSYLVLQPVTVEIAGAPEPLTPGTVDQYILENRINELDAKMAAPKPVEIPVPNFTGALVDVLSGSTAPVFQGPFVHSQGSKIQFAQEKTPGDDSGQTGEKIAGLPQLPAATISNQGAGRSLVLDPEIRGGAGRNQPAGGGNRGARAVADEPEGKDQDWVSVFYTIPSQALAESFKTAGVREDLSTTIVLDVDLIRETQQADGSWGEETVVQQPEFLNIPPFPGDNRGQQAAYADWAAQNAAAVLQPAFYQISNGDPWPPVELVSEEVDQATLQKRAAERQRKIDDRKRQLDDRRRIQQQKRPTQNRRQPGRNVGPGGGMPGFYAPRDAQRPARRAQAAPPMMPPMMDPLMGGMPLPGGMMPPGMEGMPGGMQPGGRQINSRFKAPGLPQGEFDPAQLEEDIQGWLHDVTVAPGAVYRYKIRYKVRNPMFELRALVSDPKLAEQFAIESPDSDWSDEIEIDPLSYFFVSGGIRPDGQAVRFEVFRAHGGGWEMEPFDVSPGDLLGREVDGVDFATGWTIVALHRDPRTSDTLIMLVDESGNMQTRDFASDQSNPIYKDLKQEIAQAEAADARTRASAR